MTRCSRFIVYAIAVVSGFVVTACAPLRLDSRPHIRGTIVSTEKQVVGIRHKSGRTYRIALTRETRITHYDRVGEAKLCPGLRATVYLAGEGTFSASAVTLFGDACR